MNVREHGEGCRNVETAHWCSCGCRCGYCYGRAARAPHAGCRCSGQCQQGNPNRPGKTVGTSTGSLDGSPLKPSDLDNPPGGTSWTGERKRQYLPFLFLRANAGDTGTRRVVDAFWESPDIVVLPGISPSLAPDIPSKFGDVALAGVDNTVYAHVWNLGRAPAHEVMVEFFWVNPSLGISGSSATRIGETWVALGARGSGQAHQAVKCPTAWQATFVNGGHECLLARAWDIAADPLGTPEWDASLNRHIGQRNIHVVSGPEAAGQPVTLNVGPLFGTPATVSVERVHPTTVPWLQLRGGRGQFPGAATPTGAVLLSPPSAVGGGLATGAAATSHQVESDGQQVTLTTTDLPPAPGDAHVYRVSASQAGQTFGGYTVVLLGS
jgi:hypothetical protein